MSDNDDLRRLLHDTAGDITPQGGFEEIQARAAAGSGARRWLLPGAVAAAVLGLVLGGSVWMLQDDEPSARPPATSPTDNVTSPPEETPTNEPDDGSVGPDVPAKVLYAGPSRIGHSLFEEEHQVASIGDTGQVDPLAAVREAMQGEPLDPDYRSLWPADIEAESASFDGVGDDGQIGITLPVKAQNRPTEMTDRDATLAILAVVRTAQAAFGGHPDVVFYQPDGTLFTTLLGVPSDTWGAGDDMTYLAPVQIQYPTDGAHVSGDVVKVRGFAATFEANVVWELVDADGKQVDSGFDTARECCVLSEYAFNLTLQPGTYTLTVHDTDESGEGGPVNSDSKEFVVG